MQTSFQQQKISNLPPNHSECLKKIKNLFSLIISKQNENSILKNQLFSFQGFFPEFFFIKLDYFSKKNITTLDILHYLELHKFKFNDEIIRRFIKQYDRHGNFNLIYEDFVNIIIPWDKNYDINIIKNFDENRDLELSNFDELDQIFCQILINELKLIGLIGDEIMNIRKMNEFDSYTVFEEISSKGKFFNGEMLFDFLEGKFNTMEINRLVYFIDRNNDGLISFDDFHDLLMPIKSDFEVIENSKEFFFNNNENQMNIPLINNIYLHQKEYNGNYNFENYNKGNYQYERKTYYINYNTKTRNRNYNSKSVQNKYYYNNKNSKEFILNKYINNSEPIHEQNESYEKENENIENKNKDKKNEEEIENEKNNNEKNISSSDTKILNENKKSESDNNEMMQDENPKNENKNIKKDEDNKNLLNDEKTNINENNQEKNDEMLNKENEVNNNLNDDLKAENVINEQINSIKKENIDLEQDKENINDNNNVYLQKFPNTFGKNQDNDNSLKNINDKNSINTKEYNNINNKNNQNKKNLKKILLNKKIKKTKINSEIPFQNSYYNNLKFYQDNSNLTFYPQSKLNLELNPYEDIIPSNTYNFPLIEDRNINFDIKNDNVIDNNGNKFINVVDIMSTFFEYIKLIIYYENKLEHLKESLSLREDLSVKEIFYLFDKDKTKNITINNFQLICKKVFKIFPTRDQIKLVFKRYKNNLNLNSKGKKDFSLTQEEFMKIFIPKKSDYESINSYKNKAEKINKTKSKLSNKSKNILIEFIKCLIIKESNYYKIRCQLDQNNLEFIWREIHKNSTIGANIGKLDLNQFLEEYGYILGEKQLEIIFNIFDKDNKGLINDNDFFEEMCC